MLSGRGPKIKIWVTPVGNVSTELKSEFIDKGINQTLHKVFLNVKCNVSILTAFDKIEKEIDNHILIIENVIIGRIPETYYNLKGLGESDAIQMMGD